MQVLIVDRFVPIIHRLKEMLLEINTITDIYSSVSYKTAIKVFTEKKPGIVLLGVSLPEHEFIKLLREIKTVNSKTSVIVLSINMDEYIHEQCRSLGADYFLDKYRDFESIPEVINDITNARG